MAGRFLIQKFSSQICKSRSLLSVAARAGAPVPAARYLNTFQRSCASAKTNCSTTSMPSIIINHLKPACVDSSGGAKASFSSTASTQHKISRKAKMAALTTEWDAKTAAWQAQIEAMAAADIEKRKKFSKFVRNQGWFWVFFGTCSTALTLFPADSGTSFCNGQRCGVSKS